MVGPMRAITGALGGGGVGWAGVRQQRERRVSDWFSGEAGWLLVSAEEIVLFTDGRFQTQAKEETRVGEVEIVAEEVLSAVAGAVGERKLAPVGFESQSLSFASYQRLAEALGEAIRPTENLVEGLRLAKDEGELGAVEEALRLTEEALERVVPQVQLGVTETEVAGELEHTMRRLGAERAAFETIVAFGERAALPHARPTTRRLGAGEVVLMDTGAAVNGYCADITRTFFFGEPTAPARKAYEAVLAAQEAGLREVQVGRPCCKAHQAARQALEKEGLGEAFKHSLGHGVGIEVHEGPRVSEKSKDEFAAGMVVTVEPGVYIEGQFGIRTEDMVVVGEGGARTLTRYPKLLGEMVLAP